jgi:hypothetical protein
VQVFFWFDFIPFDCMPSGGIAGSYGSSNFRFLRTPHAVERSDPDNGHHKMLLKEIAEGTKNEKIACVYGSEEILLKFPYYPKQPLHLT